MTKIVEITQVLNPFQKAHQYILDNAPLTKTFWYISELNKRWEEMHGAHIITDDSGGWIGLKFPSEADYMLWLIKWS